MTDKDDIINRINEAESLSLGSRNINFSTEKINLDPKVTFELKHGFYMVIENKENKKMTKIDLPQDIKTFSDASEYSFAFAGELYAVEAVGSYDIDRKLEKKEN